MRKLTILLLLLPTLFLSACSTNPYNTPTNRSGLAISQHAAMGALGGAVAGVIIGDNTKSTLIGAGIGAAVMGGAKAYQENK
jgi:uncharacterized membrane protein